MPIITAHAVRAYMLAHAANFKAFGLLSDTDVPLFTRYIDSVVADIPPGWYEHAPNIPALLWRYDEEPDALPPLIVVTRDQWAVSSCLIEARARTGWGASIGAYMAGGVWRAGGHGHPSRDYSTAGSVCRWLNSLGAWHAPKVTQMLVMAPDESRKLERDLRVANAGMPEMGGQELYAKWATLVEKDCAADWEDLPEYERTRWAGLAKEL